MKSLIYRHTSYRNNREVTTLYILGVPIFKRVVIEADERPRRICGFNVFHTEAPGHFASDFDDEDTE